MNREVALIARLLVKHPLVLVWVTILIIGQLRAQTGDQEVAAQLESRAWSLVGLDRLPEKGDLPERLNLEIVVSRDSTSPFIADKMEGKRVWRARCESVLLKFESCANCPVPSREYKLEVYFDSATAQLLKISLLNDQHDTSIVKKPSAASAEEQLRHPPRTWPRGDPATSLIQVLANLPQCPTMATEVVAFYWLMNRFDPNELVPIWEIYLYGSPYFGVKPDPGESLSDRSFARYLVDASNGRWLEGSNTPKPK